MVHSRQVAHSFEKLEPWRVERRASEAKKAEFPGIPPIFLPPATRRLRKKTLCRCTSGGYPGEFWLRGMLTLLRIIGTI